MGGAAAAALLGGGAYAYHRNRKKKKNAYGEEEKEAQYKPYTSYTPPIISPYHMIKKSDDPQGGYVDDGVYYPNTPPNLKVNSPNTPTLLRNPNPNLPKPIELPTIPERSIEDRKLFGLGIQKQHMLDNYLDDLEKHKSYVPSIDENFLAQEGGPNYLKTQDPPTPAAPEDPGAIDEDFLAQEGGPDYLKTQDPSWFERNQWPLLGGLAAAGLLGGGAYAYHRSKQKENKKDSTEDDDEEKEAQYKPYTSYTPPIISPYKFFNYYG